MSTRATWKGLLQISLVRIPIQVYPATEASEGLHFNQLHGSCSTRITQRKWCLTCAKEIPAAEIVKGFEFAVGRYVILSDDELATVKPESTRVIQLTQFAPATALDPLYIDRTYYLRPDGTDGQAFAVIREAMTGKVGIGALAIYGREYLVAVRRRQDALLLHTLHHAAEIRSLEREDDQAKAVVPFSQVRLARQVIAAFEGPLDLSAFTDRYVAEVRALIAAKIAGEEIVTPAPVVDGQPIGNWQAALAESLAAARGAKKKAAAKPTPKRARAS